ncbi:unnamed protein product [Parascedosporium putredinis]|uniref:P-type Cu(+) transporter n=1 Tax=Parascedosporium putredinis TaxID=1442378 RepID=A0A9P1HB24_9PEZI|nr:unnamed protein product [Parascedosporium putredinis]CAI8003454.1 unnamed protein product [Parascedosporium putredinis]
MAPAYIQVPGVDTDGRRPSLSAPHMATTTLRVGGMTCGACTSAVESGFKNVAGVGNVSTISAEQIQEIIEDRGFDADVLATDLPSPLFPRHSSTLDEKPSTTTTIGIEGMTCGACTSAVEAGFQDVPGLHTFNISLLAERAIIEHDADLLSAEKIASIIEDRGFDATIISSVKTAASALGGAEPKGTVAITTVAVEGMTCGACTSAVEGGFADLDGLLRFNISLLAERAVITHDTSKLTADQIAEIIEDRGNSTAHLKLYGTISTPEATLLENTLLGLPGIYSASVNLPSSRLTVVHKPALIGLRAIVEVIEGQGLNALVADNEDNNAQLESLAKTREITEWRTAFRTSFCFAVPVFILSMVLPMIHPWILFGIGKRFYISAYRSIKHKSPTMDVLVILGTSILFDTSTMLITFITLGRFVENSAKGQTSKALSRLMSLAPSMATIYADPIAAEKAAEQWDKSTEAKMKDDAKTPASDGNASEEKIIPTELIQVGDIVILRPGDKIPADGIIVRGETYVDESMVTGEAMPVEKKKGSIMIEIVKLVQEAQTTRAPIQRLADLIAGYFVPCILVLGFLTFASWMVLSHVLPNPPAIFLKDESGGKVMVCFKLCISVVVFACPCALGLATPTAVMVGTGVGAENGILVKGGAALETTTKVTQVVLDKTGTITHGKMSVAKADLTPTWSASSLKTRLWWAVVGLSEMGSEHPVGKAILAAAKEHLGVGSDGMIEGSVGNFKAVVGKGISAEVEPALNGDRERLSVLVGNVKFLKENGVSVPQEAVNASELVGSGGSVGKGPSTGTTNIFIAINGDFAGYICLADTIKEGAAATIAVLHRMGVKTAMVTGDQRSTALAVARAVGIPEDQVWAGVSPDQKQEIIREIQERGEVVAMVGDGINDSPALATADVGIAMASGTDVAMEAADVVLMRPTELMDIPASLHLARHIFNRIKLNLAWACLYNAVGLPFAMGLFLPLGLHLHPMASGAAMACSSVSVVASSLLLKFWKRPSYMNDALASKGGKLRRRGSWGVRAWVKDLLGRRTERRGEGYVPLQTLEQAEV